MLETWLPGCRPRLSHVAIVTALLAVAVYLDCINGNFVSDDLPIVVENSLVRAPSGWKEFLATPYWNTGPATAAGGAYRPLTMVTYALNARLSGFQPSWFHLVNVALHAANAALLCLLVGTFGWGSSAALFCGSAFAVLPIHTKAVCWVVGRAELLAAFFILAAWLCLYCSAGAFRLGLGLTLFLGGLLSKESAAAFPAVFALSELAARRWPLRDVLRRRSLVWLSLLSVLGLYLEWRRLILGSALSIGRPYFEGRSRLTAFLTMARFFWRGWAWPMATGTGLCADCSRPGFPDSAGYDLAAWLALGALVVLILWALRDFCRPDEAPGGRRRSAAAFCVLTLLALAAPLSNLLAPMTIIGAERLMYLPSVGFCLLLGAFWRRAPAAARPRLAAAAGLLLLGWSALTMRRNLVWHSEASLWAANAQCAPGNPRVLLGLGQQSDLAGRHREAREYYRRALQADPDLEQALYNSARSSYDEGDAASAQAAISVALQRWPPGTRDDWCLLGVACEARRGYAGAAAAYRRAIDRDGRYALARRNLGLLLLRFGDRRAAVAQLETYLSLNPPASDAREIRGWLSALR